MGEDPFFTHRDKQILLVDFSGCGPEEIKDKIPALRQVISRHPPGSLRILTDVTDTRFNRDTNEQLKAYAAANSPYVKRSAIVGATGLRRVVLQGVRLFTGRDIRPFNDRESAVEWLVKEA